MKLKSHTSHKPWKYDGCVICTGMGKANDRRRFEQWYADMGMQEQWAMFNLHVVPKLFQLLGRIK